MVGSPRVYERTVMPGNKFKHRLRHPRGVASLPPKSEVRIRESMTRTVVHPCLGLKTKKKLH